MPKAIAIRKVDGKPGQVYYPLDPLDIPTPTPGPNEVLVAIHTTSLNHRDLYVRQHLYPGVAFGIPLCSDSCGHVVSTGTTPAAQAWAGKRVILLPNRGWAADPAGPESTHGILGGTKTVPQGTLAELIAVDADAIEEAPSHLSDAQAAALPLTGLTAWRAVVTKAGDAGTGPGRNVLVTGIGGGVALMALAIAKARGARVYVTSGSEDKLVRATGELGAAGGVSYKEEGWEKKLAAMLPKERPQLDAIIDGAGGDVVDKAVKLMRNGGIIVSYGMTLGPRISFSMSAVLKNLEFRGSTMGSRAEFAAMLAFVRAHRITPVVSRVARGGLDDLDGIEGLFEEMKKGSQFGKLVVEIKGEGSKL